jgi:hypothetical protein
MSTHNQRPMQPQSHGGVAVARLFWFVFGPIALAILAYAIISSGTGWTTWQDAAFLAVIALMLLARWYELRSGEGQDEFGNPATLADLPRYARWLIPIAAAVWVATNVLGNHVLS